MIQVYEMVKILLLHVKCDDELGKLIRINIETEQLCMGTESKILLPKERTRAYTTKNWVHNLSNLLYENKMGIKIHNIWALRKNRIKDAALMDLVKGHFCDKELQAFNQCRLFVQCNMVSDMCKVNGTKVLPEVMNVTGRGRKSTLIWPQQKRPGAKSQELWKMVMNMIADNEGVLINALGRWVKNPDQELNYFEKLRVDYDINGESGPHPVQSIRQDMIN